MNRLSSTCLAAAAFAALGSADGSATGSPDAAVLHLAAKGAVKGTSEVASFLRRRSACNRLSETDGSDPDRVAETVSARFGFRCSTLEDEEGRLRARYADRPEVIEALDRDGGPGIGEE